jgi:hypothetical protein
VSFYHNIRYKGKRILGNGIYNTHTFHEPIRHPFVPIGSLLATSRNLGRACSTIPSIIGVLAPMVDSTKPSTMVNRKPLSYRTYKEGSDQDAYISYF